MFTAWPPPGMPGNHQPSPRRHLSRWLRRRPPGKLTYEIARQLVDDIVLVSEDDIRQSMVALIQRNKVITEGAGALACAALLSGKLDSYIQNRKTVSLISGAISISPGYRKLPVLLTLNSIHK